MARLLTAVLVMAACLAVCRATDLIITPPEADIECVETDATIDFQGSVEGGIVCAQTTFSVEVSPEGAMECTPNPTEGQVDASPCTFTMACTAKQEGEATLTFKYEESNGEGGIVEHEGSITEVTVTVPIKHSCCPLPDGTYLDYCDPDSCEFDCEDTKVLKCSTCKCKCTRNNAILDKKGNKYMPNKYGGYEEGSYKAKDPAACYCSRSFNLKKCKSAAVGYSTKGSGAMTCLPKSSGYGYQGKGYYYDPNEKKEPREPKLKYTSGVEINYGYEKKYKEGGYYGYKGGDYKSGKGYIKNDYKGDVVVMSYDEGAYGDGSGYKPVYGGDKGFKGYPTKQQTPE